MISYLVVSDDAALVEKVEGILVRFGAVTSGSTAAAARRHVEALRPFAAIIDVRSDGPSGLADEFAQQRIPILFIQPDGHDADPPQRRDRPVLRAPFEDLDLVVEVIRMAGLPASASGDGGAVARIAQHAADYSEADVASVEKHRDETLSHIAMVERALAQHWSREGEQLLRELRRNLAELQRRCERIGRKRTIDDRE